MHLVSQNRYTEQIGGTHWYVQCSYCVKPGASKGITDFKRNFFGTPCWWCYEILHDIMWCHVMFCTLCLKKKIMSCDVMWCWMMWCHVMFSDAAPLRMNRLLICGKPSHQMEEWRGPGLNRKNIYFIFILHNSYFLNKDICTQVGIDCEYYLWHKLHLETHLQMTKTYANLYVT